MFPAITRFVCYCCLMLALPLFPIWPACLLALPFWPSYPVLAHAWLRCMPPKACHVVRRAAKRHAPLFFLLVATAGRTTGSDNGAKLRAREDGHGADVFIAMLLLGLARGSFAFLVCPVGGRVLARAGDWLPSGRRSVYLHWQTARRFLPCAVKITSPPSCLDPLCPPFPTVLPIVQSFFSPTPNHRFTLSAVFALTLFPTCVSRSLSTHLRNAGALLGAYPKLSARHPSASRQASPARQRRHHDGASNTTTSPQAMDANPLAATAFLDRSHRTLSTLHPIDTP